MQTTKIYTPYLSAIYFQFGRQDNIVINHRNKYLQKHQGNRIKIMGSYSPSIAFILVKEGQS